MCIILGIYQTQYYVRFGTVNHIAMWWIAICLIEALLVPLHAHLKLFAVAHVLFYTVVIVGFAICLLLSTQLIEAVGLILLVFYACFNMHQLTRALSSNEI